MNIERPTDEQLAMADAAKDRAFSDIFPIVEPAPKPRATGLTEIRSPAYSLPQLAGIVEALGDYIDSVKWTCGTQRLLPRAQVKAINDYLHGQGIEVSTGGLIETVLPHGEAAVYRYLEQSKELGFDIVELSSAMVSISLADKCSLVKAVNALGMKAKPEVTGWSPGDRGRVSADKMIREAEAVIEAGAWTVMIEEDGIFSSGNDANAARDWNLDVVWRLASRIPDEKLYWEASSVSIIRWLLNSFGPAVNIFSGADELGYIAAFRSGTFAMTISAFKG
ncbi:MAG TPA: phosphosulfolactate synthase [Sphingopyxis sp.]|nr:phosphosulfolactate synthase [Sphingopyxis sp.]HMP46463.1 phosphosulfolactate synthase [Sphingopyxis sp.]HMQ18033.1 phosphosulfolactate synthase [Sphingopyxis sp.]